MSHLLNRRAALHGACFSSAMTVSRISPLKRPVLGRQRTLVCRASLIPDQVDDIVTMATIVVSGLAILGTAGLAVRNPKSAPPPDEDNMQYGVMGVVSLIPLVNWTAWILPALQNPERAALYYSFAALYSYPLLRDGFDIEKYGVLMLVLGAIHIQVERIAVTEPATFQNLKPLSGVLNVFAFVAEKVFGFAGSLLGILASDSKQALTGGSNPRTLEDGSAPDVDVIPKDYELKEFDRRMMARDAARRRQQQQQGKQNRRE